MITFRTHARLRSRHGRRPTIAWSAPVALAAAASIATAGGTYALWNATGAFAGGVLGAGDLTLSVGDLTCRQVAPDGASGPCPTQPGPHEDTSAQYVSMPGDVVQIRVPVTTTLHGDNLRGALTVRFVDHEAERLVENPVTVGFHIEDPDGGQVAPEHGDATVGDVLAVPATTATAASATSTWTAVVTAQVAGEHRWVSPDGAGDPTSWQLGNLLVALDQVRAAADRTQAAP